MAVTLYGVIGGGGEDNLFPVTDVLFETLINADSDPHLDSGVELTTEVPPTYEADFTDNTPTVNIV